MQVPKFIHYEWRVGKTALERGGRETALERNADCCDYRYSMFIFPWWYIQEQRADLL